MEKSMILEIEEIEGAESKNALMKEMQRRTYETENIFDCRCISSFCRNISL
jgi:hypothetical protein